MQSIGAIKDVEVADGLIYIDFLVGRELSPSFA
jgi:hypothetical protein